MRVFNQFGCLVSPRRMSCRNTQTPAGVTPRSRNKARQSSVSPSKRTNLKSAGWLRVPNQATAKTIVSCTAQKNATRGRLMSYSAPSVCMVTRSNVAEPPPTRDVNRDSGTESANGGWLRRLVEPSRCAADLAAGLSSFRVQWCGWL